MSGRVRGGGLAIRAREATVELATDPEKPSSFSLGGRTRGGPNPSFDELLAFLDEVERWVPAEGFLEKVPERRHSWSG